jgi:predicted PurR-regulated permease PerM
MAASGFTYDKSVPGPAHDSFSPGSCLPLPRSMPIPQTRSSNASALGVIAGVLLTSFVIGMLYFARDILIPLALAALLTFLLAPLVTRLERWIGRIAAVLTVVIMIFAGLAGTGWILTRQVIDLATQLPNYKENIAAKLHAFRVSKGGTFFAVSQTVEDLKKEFPGGSAEEIAPTVTRSAGKLPVTSPPGAPTNATPVRVVETSKASSMDLLRAMVAPLLGPAGTAALVLLLVIFMLLQREDLRGRLIRLIGQGRISATTRALDDAAQRVSRYLLMQLIVNVSYGIPVAIGLYFIGVPNAILWGGFAAVLRFIPYVGPWIGAAMPVALALAVSPGWLMPFLTLGLFVMLELLSANFMEPWLYSSTTGVSSIALIVGAVAWTWLWGPVGLVMATPLTVCLVVMGRHVPRLSILTVLLSDEEALTPAEDCYHRLLRPGDEDENEFVEAYLEEHSVASLYDSVFIPVISVAEIDARQESLDQDQLLRVEQSLRDIIDDLALRPLKNSVAEPGANNNETTTASVAARCRVYCLGARAERDQLASAMLAHLLQQTGCDGQIAPTAWDPGEFTNMTKDTPVDVVCISVVAPSTVIHARFLCRKIRAQFPAMKILVGVWGAVDGVPAARQQLRDSGADEMVVSLADAVAHITQNWSAVSAKNSGSPAEGQPHVDVAAAVQRADAPAPLTA